MWTYYSKVGEFHRLSGETLDYGSYSLAEGLWAELLGDVWLNLPLGDFGEKIWEVPLVTWWSLILAVSIPVLQRAEISCGPHAQQNWEMRIWRKAEQIPTWHNFGRIIMSSYYSYHCSQCWFDVMKEIQMAQRQWWHQLVFTLRTSNLQDGSIESRNFNLLHFSEHINSQVCGFIFQKCVFIYDYILSACSYTVPITFEHVGKLPRGQVGGSAQGTRELVTLGGSRITWMFFVLASSRCFLWPHLLASYGLPWWLSGKEHACQCRKRCFNPCQEDHLEKETATCSSILACKIPWVEEPGGLQSMWSQRVRFNWSNLAGTRGILQARILEWVAISSSSGPLFFQNYSLWPIHLGWPCIALPIAWLSYGSPFTMTRLWSMKGLPRYWCFNW